MSEQLSLLVEQKPNSIEPKLMTDMTDAEITELIDAIRHRRATTGAVYEAVDRTAKVMAPSVIKAKIEKKLERLASAIAKVDAALEKAEQYANEIAGLRLQQ